MWMAVLLRLVPGRWRSQVESDVREEARRDRRSSLWMARQAVAIGARLRTVDLSQRLPRLDGLLTGFASRDMRSALRQIRRAPGSSLLSVVTLAVSVAAVVTVFGVLNQSVLNPLPFPRSDRLLAIWEIDPATPRIWRNASAGNVVEWRRDARSFDRIVASQNISLTLTGFEDGDTPLMRRVSDGYFETLGWMPVLGRTFAGDEYQPNGPAVAILSYAIWQARYAGSQSVLGRTIELDGRPYRIVGVAPPGDDMPAYQLLDAPQVYLPLPLPESGASRTDGRLLALGRLRDGVSIDAAREELLRLSEHQARDYPDTNGRVRASVQPLSEPLVRPVRTPLTLLMVAVIGLLAAACGNVANLQRVRAMARQHEFALAQALGASRARLLLQVVAESVMLAATAGMAAVWLATAGGAAVRRLMPAGFLAPRVDFSINLTELVVAGLVAAAAALVTSLPAIVIALRAADGALVGAGSLRTTSSRERRRWAAGLVALEMAVAVVLVAGAGLAAIGFEKRRATPPGFVPDGALTFRVSTRGNDFAKPEARAEFYERVLDEFARIPGVVAVGAMTALPVFAQFDIRGVYAAGTPAPEPGAEPQLTFVPATEGWFPAFGLPVLAGRGILADDRAGTAPVAVLSLAAAARVFPDAPAAAIVGRQIAVVTSRVTRIVDVVGIADDVRSASDATVPNPVVYVPFRQQTAPPSLGFVMRASGEPAAVERLARQAVGRVNRSMPLYLARPLTDVADALDAALRLTAALLVTFAVLGVVLVGTGLYATLSQLVVDRRREMGVRVALGATQPLVLRTVLGDGLRPAALGLLTGLAGAMVFGRVLATAVVGTPAFDVRLFVLLPVALLVLAALASAVPAWRATRVDPTVALRDG